MLPNQRPKRDPIVLLRYRIGDPTIHRMNRDDVRPKPQLRIVPNEAAEFVRELDTRTITAEDLQRLADPNWTARSEVASTVQATGLLG